LKTEIWKDRSFLCLLFSQSFENLAKLLMSISVMIEIYSRTESVFNSASVLALTSFGSFLGGLLASKMLHRFSVLRVMSQVSVFQGGMAVLIGYLLISSISTSLFLILGILFISSFVGAWYQPSRFAALPMLVGKDQYLKANGLLVLAVQLIYMAGWGLGGVIVLFVPLSFVIALITLAFFASALCVRLIHAPHGETNDDAETTHDAPSFGRKPWSALVRHPFVRTLTIMEWFETLANAIWGSALLLAFTTVILKQDTSWWGILNACYFLGTLLGSSLMIKGNTWVEKRMGLMICCCGLGMGVLTILFAYSPYAWVAALLCILMGPVYAIRDICQETALQTVLNRSELATVMSARHAILWPWMGISYMIMGAIADLWGVFYVYIGGGILYLLASIVAILQTEVKRFSYQGKQYSPGESGE
jgi:MFS family permease